MFESRDDIVNQWWSLRLTSFRAFSRLLGVTVFPPRCCLCGLDGRPPDLDLCEYCQADLPWEPPRHCGLVAALRYEWPADVLIRELKYQGDIAHARVLGELLAQAVRERAEALPRLLLPVPLHPARLRERGFNQALLIARFTARALQIPYARGALRRVRDTPSQTGLGKSQRFANMRGAFEIRGERALRRLIRAGHVALVDDVTTTGATLRELQGALLQAGVARVDLWAVAQASPSAAGRVGRTA
jgi:ComF family protein